MTATFGSSGLATQTYAEARAAIVTRLQAAFGAVNVDTSSVFGQLASIMAEMDVAQQDALLALWSAHDPLSAQGVALDHLAALTGTVRRGPTAGYVEITFSGTGGSWVAPVGTVLTHDATGTAWTTAAEATLIAPTVRAYCGELGPVAAPAGSAWTVGPGTTDVTGAANATDAVQGAAQESDGDLRRRRNVELYASSQGPLRALSGRVSRVEGVRSVRTYHNPTVNPVDAFGVPYKAFEVVAWLTPTPPATINADIAEAIWTGMGAGGEAHGAITEVIVDSEGVAQTIKFSTVSTNACFPKVTLHTASAENATQSAAEALAVLAPRIAAAALAWAVPGRDITSLDVLAVVTQAMASGDITGFTSATIGFATSAGGPWPAGPYVIARDEVSEILAGNVSVEVAL